MELDFFMSELVTFLPLLMSLYAFTAEEAVSATCIPVDRTGIAFPILDRAFDAVFAPEEVTIFLTALPALDLLTLESVELTDFTFLSALPAVLAAFPKDFAESYVEERDLPTEPIADSLSETELFLLVRIFFAFLALETSSFAEPYRLTPAPAAPRTEEPAFSADAARFPVLLFAALLAVESTLLTAFVLASFFPVLVAPNALARSLVLLAAVFRLLCSAFAAVILPLKPFAFFRFLALERTSL